MSGLHPNPSRSAPLKAGLTDFRSSVEPAHQIRGDVVVSHVRGGAEVAQLQDGLRLVYLSRTQTH